MKEEKESFKAKEHDWDEEERLNWLPVTKNRRFKEEWRSTHLRSLAIVKMC